jgi:hypothetical protein
MNFRGLRGIILCLLWLACLWPWPVAADPPPAAGERLHETVAFFAGLGDRFTGSEGNHRAAAYIRERLQAAEPEELDSLDFKVAVRTAGDATLEVNGRSIPLAPLFYNAITPENIPEQGLTGPLLYVGRGELADFNGRSVEGAVVLMEFDSGTNWLNAASLGASALVYINRGTPGRNGFLEKEELSPIQFPCFVLDLDQPATLDFDPAAPGDLQATVRSTIRWQKV